MYWLRLERGSVWTGFGLREEGGEVGGRAGIRHMVFKEAEKK